MPKHYKRTPLPGKAPTPEQLRAYLGRIAQLGQIDYYEFSKGGAPALFVAGVIFILAAVGVSLVMIYGG